MKRIPIAGPWITQTEIDAVTDAVTNAWYENATVFQKKFEAAFADRHQVPYALALPSCTSAIHLALAAAGAGPGDEVIVPDITWTASAAPVTYLGADLVFADIDRDTWCLCPKSFASLITPKTKAVVIVDLYGNMPGMKEILAIANDRGIVVIEDAAEAIGSKIDEIIAGTFGDIGVFSFHGTKTLTTGEGGMLITRNRNYYERACFLGDHGRRPGDRSFRQDAIAYKYKMSSMQAALGWAQVSRMDEIVAKKRQIFSWYRERLGDRNLFTMNFEPENGFNSCWMTTILWNSEWNITKEDAIQRLSEKQIDSRPFFYPLSSLEAYQHIADAHAAQSRNTVSYDISRYGINLPSALNLTEDQVDTVCQALLEIFRK